MGSKSSSFSVRKVGDRDVDLDGVKNLRWAGWVIKQMKGLVSREASARFIRCQNCGSTAENFKTTHTIPHRNDKKPYKTSMQSIRERLKSLQGL